MAFIVLIALLFIIDEPNYSRKLIFVFASFSTVFAIIERAIFRSILKHIRSNDKNLKHILIVGDGELAIKFAKKIISKKYLGYSISGFLGSHHKIGHVIDGTNGASVIGLIGDLDDFF